MSKTKVYCQGCDIDETYDNHAQAKSRAIEHHQNTDHRSRIKEIPE